MGRDTPRPAGYAPWLELCLRRKSEGGALLTPGVFRGTLDALARRECLVLVHGFNNTDGEAAAAYFGFRGCQEKRFGDGDASPFESRFGDTFWPGDADWWSFFDLVDFLIYPVAVHTAVNAARALADLLSSMPNLERVDFIAHSLGCRVALETLALLRDRATPVVGAVCLMAAAVPSEVLEAGGKFHELLSALMMSGTRMHVLYSKEDTVLHYAFPPGQALAGGGEASVRALGRFGPMPWMPGFGASLTAREIAGAGHGDYWGHSHTAASDIATEEAGRFLALGDIGRVVGAPRDVGVSAYTSAPRELDAAREIG